MAFVPDEAVFSAAEISHSAFTLYVCYCAHRNNKIDGQRYGLSWPGRETINEETGLNVTYISELKQELKRAGWISTVGTKIRPLKGFGPAKKSEEPTNSSDKPTITTGKTDDLEVKNRRNSRKNRIEKSEIPIPIVGNSDPNQIKNQVRNQRQEANASLSNKRRSTDGAVRIVFAYWQFVMGSKDSKLVPKREQKIRARLDEGYTVDDLKAAIDGCRASPHNMGRNENERKYNDIELICRDGTKVEQFREIARGAVNGKLNGRAQSSGGGNNSQTRERPTTRDERIEATYKGRDYDAILGHGPPDDTEPEGVPESARRVN